MNSLSPPCDWMTVTDVFNHSLESGLRHVFASALRKVYDKLQPSPGESEDRCSCRKHEIEKQQGCSALKFDLKQFYQTSKQQGLQDENQFIMK